MLPAKKLSRGWAAARVVLTVVFLFVAVWLWLNQQYVVDQLAAWQFKPSGEIAALADRSGMNNKGRFLYYASHPEIDGTQRFNKVCDRREEGTAILGCYNGSKIFIYDVKDERLNGIKEVTAAHEMLHAAFQRMSGDERQKLSNLLEIEYKKLENRDDYKERMAFYARTEPGERANELHSVIGTEVTDVSTALEAHFAKYFADRSKVVALHSQYQAVFQKLEGDAKALYDELQTLSRQITTASTGYNDDVVALNSAIQAFNRRATTGDFTSEAQFVRERAALVSQADRLRTKRDSINGQVSSYEAKRQAYNALAHESQELVDSLNSKLAPAPEV